MANVPDQDEFVIHCAAVIAARRAAGLEAPTQTLEDPWWEEGPHFEKGGRSYYVHALGCLESSLGDAMQEHPGWYLVTALVRGRSVEVHGIEDDEARTLGEVHASLESLNLDDMSLAVELTPHEKRGAWGVTSPDP